MSSFFYRDRETGPDKSRPRSLGPHMDTEKNHAAAQSHSLRDFEQHLSDLKKENFSLKLRIYFLEERVQGQSPDPDLSKTNVELNVQLQSLKKDLEEKENLLQQAHATLELLSNQNAEEQQQRDEATNQVQASLEARLQQLQQELEQRRQSEMSQQRLHKQALEHKDRVILELTSEKLKLQQKIQEQNSARKRPHSPQRETEQRDHSELKRVLEEQSGQLSHCEVTSEQCLKELQDAQNQVRTLQTKIRISEDRNRMLQKRLGEMEVELRIVREEAQNQERNLQNLTDSLCSKDQEVADLLRVVEDQNRTLSTGLAQVNPGDAAAVQSELFSLQLALDSAHRALRTRERTEKDLRGALERVESDLRGALQRGRERLQHNQELVQILDQTRTHLRDSEEQLRDQQNQVKRLNQDHNQIIGDLKERLRQKEEMVQVQKDLLESTDQDSQVQKLRHVLQDREQDLQRVLLDRTRSLAQSKELQELLRDKNQDLQTQKQVLLSNQETIRSLEVLVRGQSLQVEQLRDSLRKSGLKEELVQSELNRSLSERDSVVRSLQEILQERDQEVQDLRSFLSQNPLLPDDVMHQLKLRLQLKDRLLQEVMSQRTRQIQEQQDQVQELTRTIDQRDQYIQDLSPRFLELLKEQSDTLKELRTQLSSGLNPDQNLDQNPDEDLVKDEVWILKEQLKKTQEHQHQTQQDLEDKNHLVKKLVLELQRLRGRLHADCDPDRSLILGLESEEEVPVSGDEDTAEFRGPQRHKGPQCGPQCGPQMLEQLLQQKKAVDRELHELKTQVHKTGFSSLSQIRKALLDLRTQNQKLRWEVMSQREEVMSQREEVMSQQEEVMSQREEVMSQQEEAMSQQEEHSDQWEAWDSELTFDPAQNSTIPQESPLHRGAVDLGYETCEKSETEAERDTSSPEFDDLEMCLSLDHGSNWWNTQGWDQDHDQDQDQNQDEDLDQDHNQTPTLSPDHSAHHRPREVQELQKLVQHLKSELNRSKIQVQRLQVQRLQTSLRPQSEAGSNIDPDLADLLNRVETLENQIKTEPRTENKDKSKTGFLAVVHLQARELSHLRQVLRESRGLVQILVQSLSEHLKGLESLLTSREPDYSLGQKLREDLQELHRVMERLSTKISLKELPEDPDDKTELLAMRLSKELQQKDLLIQSLRSKLRPDTPSDSSDQSECISYVSDEQLSNQDEDLGSETNSELQMKQSQTSGQSEHNIHYSVQSDGSINTHGQSEAFSNHTELRSMFSSVPPSVASAHSFPMMHCSRTLLSPGHVPSGDPLRTPLLRPIAALAQPGFSSSSLDSGLRPGLAPGPGLGPGLPHSCGALWDMPSNQPVTQQLYPSASSYHSLTGPDLLGEHLCEVRSLRLRLEESIQTNERLRLHLETHLDPPPSTAPTNIYIQSPESTETRALRETNLSLKNQLRDSVLESERLKEAFLLVQTRLKEVELQVQRWVELSQSSQSEANAQKQEVTRLQQEMTELRQERHRLQGTIQDLQQELRNRENQSEQRNMSRSQSETSKVSRSQSERPARRRLQFTDAHPESRPDQDLHPDLDPSLAGSTEGSGSALKSGLDIQTKNSIRLQKTLQDSVDLIQTINQTLMTQTKPGLSQDCERLMILLQEALSLSYITKNIKENHQVKDLQEQVQSLRQKLLDQEQSLNGNKKDLERLILSQLSKTRDVLRKAKTNLQAIRGDVMVS
ncbi:myomegalin-like [Boleophthalmus pectinirostris]|uniref:myomegalin-like n=1 Tax=Boleophthalmus pectinirostris TaxID=150288 RepID=UPI002430B2EB|nr:myomegalin-like [Boleophthalmus pectinirostris]